MTNQQKQPRRIDRQSGWTFWSLLFTLSVVLFFSFVGMQLVPIYTENGNIKNAMVRALEDENLNTITRATVIRKLNAQLYLDGTHDLLDYKTDLVVKRSNQKVIVETHYQREVPLFYNISVLAKFDNIVEENL